MTTTAKNYSMWVGGAETNQTHLTKEQAEFLQRVWVARGYKDVKIYERGELMSKYWKVTTYYPLTSMSVVVAADNEPQAYKYAIDVMEDEWGKGVHKHEDYHISEEAKQ